MKGMNMNESTSRTDKIVNRHMARLLCELEDAKCPDIFIDAVKSKLVWMRNDLNEMNKGDERNELPKVFRG